MRLIIVGFLVLGLFAGCNQTRDVRYSGANNPGTIPPDLTTGMTPLHEQINGGLNQKLRHPRTIAQQSLPPEQTPTSQAPRTARAPLPLPKIENLGTQSVASNDQPEPTPPVPTLQDDAVLPTSDEAPMELSLGALSGNDPIVSEWIARVDGDIITENELAAAVRHRLDEFDPSRQAPADQVNLLKAAMLDSLIDRSLVVQRARRQGLSDPKRWQMVTEAARAHWEETKLPILVKRYNAEDRYDLERILKERGDSIEEFVATHTLDMIYQQFLFEDIGSKINVDLHEMRAYYSKHRDSAEFQQDAQHTWREIVVKYGVDRDGARAKAETALGQLQQGEPFDALARSISEGPNADDGGLWKTAPGSYRVAAVNETLAQLQPGQLSGIVEGDEGFHILLLESRRPAGLRSFADMQDEIREILRDQKREQAQKTYLNDLYRGSVVETVINDYVPRHLRPDDD